MDISFLHDFPEWSVMWGMALLIYAAMKVLTWSVRRETDAPAWKHAAYLLAWPGMDVDTFLNERSNSRVTRGEWLFAAGKTALGVLLIVFAFPAAVELGVTFRGWIGMLGVAFTLHFGLGHLLSCLWRSRGIEARPIMNWPVAALSLADFWGHRWNLAFRDLTSRFVFRPLLSRLGPSWALFAGFVVSGLIHDLVISVPAGGGYGLPTLYFVLQGGVVLAQRKRRRAARAVRSLASRLQTAAWLALPSPLLFHSWFLECVFVPFLRTVSTGR